MKSNSWFDKDFFRYLALFSNIGFTIFINIFFSIVIYKYFEKYFFKSFVIFFIFLALGIFNAFYSIYKSIMNKK
ncbi:AtpZ/AtpI family protein [Fusobacterium gastrosuis]|uniref:AtpZ/AtpI family protein n=1 Tax=Fusobacterium gastrosuis TaxID=1755100 RepID=UPI0025F4CA22|nr:AtpZ/AtpI family protein [uncultured Fusobacterium sp.]MDD7392330.1 AtpZ/AtpI family protein [Fusobacteriaceae bacterium]MDD7409827.1 AtpZ/AtpI family protein [Fusobacteriaceae bacterium]MDY5712949.1 AtpZ/AtpI family protein [Fusobacterium gastrosuis]MDY5795716.1 AtpZ/AtpI family protein [Fusobacterium gastrosuis]